MSLLGRAPGARIAITRIGDLSRISTTCAGPKFQRYLASAASRLYEPRPTPVDNSPPGAIHDDRVLRQIFDSSDLWREFSQSSKYGPGRKSLGLVQNRYLTDAQGFEDFVNTSLANAKRVVDKVMGASSVEDYKSIVQDLDRLSDLLCRVIDLCDFIRATHPDAKIHNAATEAYSKMFEYMNVLNTTPGLNDQLTIALRTPEVVASWNEQEVKVADILKRDFGRSAINLPQAQRDRFVALSQEISELGNAFSNHMGPAKQQLTFDSSKLTGVDPVIARNLTSRWGKISLPTVGGYTSLALKTVQNEDARREIFMASRTSSQASLGLLDALLRKRLELANLTGYESWGHVALEDKMAKSPESVSQFLQALSRDNKPIVEAELADMVTAKTKNPKAFNAPLQPWDREFYQAQILSSIRSRSRTPDFLAAYFSLGTVIQGISRVATRLYGIRFVPRETTPGETWNHDVRRLDIMSESDGHIGVLYCDLFSRPGKSPNPAHFTLRCSREISEDEVAEAAAFHNPRFTPSEEAANDGMATSTTSGKLMQLPTIALICDFEHLHKNANTPTLLSFGEVLTVFHEMGHALHSFIGRTSLQNVSGTRCATDFAELPSILMESFVSNPAALGLFARHYETDQPLPYHMIADRLALDKRFEGTDIENQILLSMVDQEYHTTAPQRSSFDTTQIYLDIQRSYGVLPADPPGTSWQGMFGHLFGYGSTYYSYLFDRVLAKQIWKILFASGEGAATIDRRNGEKMKESVLKWGGGRDAWKCLADVLDDPRVENGDKNAMAVVGSWGVKQRQGLIE
ncbi:mitochondrial intermediate peptidase [Coleophoma crateriformis]|uniref:Mitochondrial intermediate peptidase n=1 Tax=Coleophoma crateriformis TaxID=565419 RepID=A0A3D8RVH2_9HELO|nr:mitochondrial intermediate peptidase [Coleophoma crateriformis]